MLDLEFRGDMLLNVTERVYLEKRLYWVSNKQQTRRLLLRMHLGVRVLTYQPVNGSVANSQRSLFSL